MNIVQIKYITNRNAFTCVTCGEHVPEKSKCVYVTKSTQKAVLLRKVHLECYEEFKDVDKLVGAERTLPI